MTTTGGPARPERIGLVGCVKQKQARRSPARDLYTSPLFRGRRRFVESTCDRWYILSALHGLVDPDQPLDYYDEALTGASTSRRRAWAANVLEALDAVVADHKAVTYEVHAGADYRDFGLAAGLERRGATVDVPTAGLTQGEQLAFYSRAAQVDAGVVHAVVNRLSDVTLALPASAFPTDHAEAAQPGLYAWWCDGPGRAMLGSGLGAEVGELVYAGQAGASTARRGEERTATLASRIRGNHLGGTISSSTFRRTLAALLKDALGLQLERPGALTAESNRSLTSWMKTHLRVTIAPFPDRSGLAAVERRILLALDPPFNLAIVAQTPARRRLADLRKALGRGPDDLSGGLGRSRVASSGQARRVGGPRRERLSGESVADTLARVERAVSPGDVIFTLGRTSPNRIHGIGADGVLVSTPKSDREGRGPQLVPMWMIDDVWRYLEQHGRVDQPFVVGSDGLDIKRSAFVMALLAHFEGVRVRSTRPTTLEYTAEHRSPPDGIEASDDPRGGT